MCKFVPPQPPPPLASPPSGLAVLAMDDCDDSTFRLRFRLRLGMELCSGPPSSSLSLANPIPYSSVFCAGTEWERGKDMVADSGATQRPLARGAARPHASHERPRSKLPAVCQPPLPGTRAHWSSDAAGSQPMAGSRAGVRICSRQRTATHARYRATASAPSPSSSPTKAASGRGRHGLLIIHFGLFLYHANNVRPIPNNGGAPGCEVKGCRASRKEQVLLAPCAHACGDRGPTAAHAACEKSAGPLHVRSMSLIAPTNNMGP